MRQRGLGCAPRPLVRTSHLPASGDNAPVLAIDRLRIDFQTHDGLVEAGRGVSLAVARGECLGVVGESGQTLQHSDAADVAGKIVPTGTDRLADAAAQTVDQTGHKL